MVCAVSICTSDAIATTTISYFDDNAVSSEVLQLDDRIVKMGGMDIWTTMDISYCLQNKIAENDTEAGRAYFDMTVIRNGAPVELHVPFELVTGDGETESAGIKVDFKVLPAEKSFFNVMNASGGLFLTEARLIWISLTDLLTGTYGINDLSGPIGVVSTMAASIRIMSFSSFLTLIALITINLGIFNLLPIPALDGARFVFLLIEAIRRKPISPEKEGWVHFVGFAALMLLILVVSFNDVVKLFQG